MQSLECDFKDVSSFYQMEALSFINLIKYYKK